MLTGVHRGPYQAFYTGVKFLVLAQHPMQLCYFKTFGCYSNTIWCYVDTLGCNVNTWGCGSLLTPTGVKFNTPVFAVYRLFKKCFIENFENSNFITSLFFIQWHQIFTVLCEMIYSFCYLKPAPDFSFKSILVKGHFLRGLRGEILYLFFFLSSSQEWRIP